MKTIIYLLPLLLGCFGQLAAQTEKRANIWYFNHRAGIDFNTIPPSPLLDGNIDDIPGEGCAAISDQAGQLLLYTNGETIWNRAQQEIANNIGGNNSATQSSIIVQSPANENWYYVFYLNTIDIDDNNLNGELYYALVDVQANNGAGAVISGNNLMYDFCLEKIVAIRHCNKEDYWIIAHEAFTDNYLIWKLSETGVSTEVQVIRAASIYSGIAGAMKASPSSDRIASVDFTAGFVDVLRFDTETGRISFPTRLESPLLQNPYGLAFSPNGKLLYVSNFHDSLLLQINLELEGLQMMLDSTKIIAKLHTGLGKAGSLQNAPDGKIYVAISNSEHLGVIQAPNELGTACNFVEQGFHLGGRISGTSLPNFLPIYFRQRDTIERIELIENCDGTRELHAIANLAGDSIAYEWSFEQTRLADANSTKIQIEEAGQYDFKALVFDKCKTVLTEYTKSIDVEFSIVYPLRISNIERSDATCDEANGRLEIESEGGQPSYLYSIDGINFQAAASFSELSAGVYEIWVQDERACLVNMPVEIKQNGKPQINSLQIEASQCEDATGLVALTVTGGTGEIQNVFDGQVFSSSFKRAGLAAATYNLQITDEANCRLDSLLHIPSLNCPIYVPSAFSPNGDGQNDFFRLAAHPDFEGEVQQFSVFNRWGGLVYQLENVKLTDIAWDGSFQGKQMDAGLYTFLLEVVYLDGEFIQKSGELALLEVDR